MTISEKTSAQKQNTPTTATYVEKKGRSSAVLILGVLLLVAIGGFVWSFANFLKTKQEVALLKNPNAQAEASKKELDDLIGRISKHLVMPTGEDPILATISDVDALAKEQQFYQNAHNGDKLVVYVQAKKAIIYDPTQDKVVNVGPVMIDPNAQAGVNTAGQKLSVDVRNGSLTAGAGTKIADQLRSNSSFVIANVENAAKRDYAQTVVVDLTGGAKPVLIGELEKQFNVKAVSAMPEGENSTQSEAVVIVGQQ